MTRSRLYLTGHRPPDAAPATPNREEVPQDRPERDRLRAAARDYVAALRPTPPFTVDELDAHAGRILAATGAPERYRKWVAVLVSNEAWRPIVTAVPHSRRLMLLPKCLRCVDECRGEMDDLGLICAGCGACAIHALQQEAESLGTVVLVAEGTPAVMRLLESGTIDAVIGVSCLSALEAIYPLMESAAIPGIAVPLLFDGCADTAVDLDWVRETLRMASGEDGPRFNVDALRRTVEAWFTPEALDAALGPASGETERIAREWLARSGKRWRPVLAVCTHHALAGADAAPEDEVRRIAMAVECFHKASLVHDDIEDDDDLRYGESTLHHQYGVPVALNVGDFLLGEGYRLLAETALPAPLRAEMLRVAARGHLDLTLGQGSELCWARRPRPLGVGEVLDIFRRKTAPAFEVALRLGAIAAGETDGIAAVLQGYSEALGIAYQIHDDLKDLRGVDEPDDVLAMRPSILLALAWEAAAGADRAFFEDVCRRRDGADADEVRRRMDALGVAAQARSLMREYEQAALGRLESLTNADLKALLRRVIFRIFHRTSARDPSP
jgi:geranylgeranyl pyrophosphate synthase